MDSLREVKISGLLVDALLPKSLSVDFSLIPLTPNGQESDAKQTNETHVTPQGPKNRKKIPKSNSFTNYKQITKFTPSHLAIHPIHPTEKIYKIESKENYNLRKEIL